VSYTIPSDTHVIGDPGHTTDHNNICDMLTLLANFNVKNTAYSGGAKGDGSTDDTAAIQAALTAARTSTYGGVVYLPAGIYIISQSLQIGSDTWLIGDGRGISTIRCKASSLSSFTQVGTNTGCPLITTYNNAAASHVTIGPGLTVDGNQANAGGSVPGYADGPECSPVSIWSSSQVTVTGIEVINAIGYSVYLQACSDSFVTQNRILSGASSALGTNQQDGIHLTGCLRATVADNIVDTGTGTAGDDGIALQSLGSGSPCDNVTISGNVIRSAQSGVHLALDGGNVDNVSITGNTLWGASASSAASILIDQTSGRRATAIVISGNNLRTIAGDGIDVNVPFTGLAITDNTFDTFSNSGNNGAYIAYGTDLVFSGNTMTNCTGLSHGIQVGDSSSKGVTNFTVANNVVDMSTASSPGAGILVRDSTVGSVSGNTLISTGSTGIGIDISGVGVAPVGIAVNGNRVSGWANAIEEVNGGTQPDYNTFVANNCHGNTAFITTSGTHDVVASNVVA
jgi:Pectate lyase superfamily protein/Right handed beta helix region